MADSATPAQVTKVRLRFRKEGDLRFVSHHDLMRLFERFLRRAGLPYRQTEGFHPKPRMVFASALSLGIVGHEEVLEVEFHGQHDAEDVRRQLDGLCPEGLAFFAAKAVPPRWTGMPVAAAYEVELPPEACAGLPEKIESLRAQPSLMVERSKQRDLSAHAASEVGEERLDAPHLASPGKKYAPTPPRRIDLKPFLQELRLVGNRLLMEFLITPTGAARPEELLRLLGLESLLYQGDAVLHRTRLVLADETSPLASPVLASSPRRDAPAELAAV